MKIRTRNHHCSLSSFILLIVALASPAPKAGADLIWTNAAGDLLWSTVANWSNNVAPGATSAIYFGNGSGTTNVQGAVNNIVDTSLSVLSLNYEPAVPNYHTTLIQPGKTLTVNPTPVSDFTMKMSKTTAATNEVGYATIKGTGGATLALGNLANLNKQTWFAIRYINSRAAGNTHMATVDMSGLDNFSYGGGYFGIGSFTAASTSSARGRLLLARTNLIAAATVPGDITGTGNTLIGGILVGVRTGAILATDIGDLQLGITNVLWADHFLVGSYSDGIGTVEFQPYALTNSPSLILRSYDGVSRVNRVGIGDSFSQTTSIDGNATGTMDLTGGTVDAYVNQLTVGRNMGSSLTSRRGSGTGTLTWTAGTFDVVTANIGSQADANRGNSTGVVNVLTNASLVASTINIAGDLGSAGAGTAMGTLNIAHGAQVTVAADILENNAAAGNGSSTINITNASLSVAGGITVDTINLSSGTVSNATTLTAAVKGNGTLANVGSFAGSLIPGDTATAGSLTNLGNLTLSGAATLNFSLTGVTTTGAGVNDHVFVSGDLASAGDTITITPVQTLAIGSYRLMDYTGARSGTFNYLNQTRNTALDESTTNQVNLVVSGGGSNLVWTGTAGMDWDVVFSFNWTNTSGGAEQFYQADTVTFDDTAVQSGVNLVGTLCPGAVTVNNTALAYTFSGAGQISGGTGLTKSGTGTLTVANTNNFVGSVNVDGGTLLVNGALGSAPISVNNGGTLGGRGTVGGPVTVQSGGVFSPGASIGTNTINNTLVLSAGSTNVFEVDTDTLAHDAVAGPTSVTYGGELLIIPSGGGTAITNGASVRLFSAGSYSGSFAAIVPATPAVGLVWDASQLTVSGTLRVMSAVNPAPTNLTYTLVGNALNISWPADHTGWTLQAQTNTVNVGLSNNWYPVPGSANTNQVFMTVDPANGAVFYRLVYP